MGSKTFFWGSVGAAVLSLAGLVTLLLSPESLPIPFMSSKPASMAVDELHKPHSWQSLKPKSMSARATAADELKSEAALAQNLETLVSLLSSGQEADFLQHLEDLIRQNPHVPEYWAIRADYFFDAKNWIEAEKSLERVIQYDPENFFARATLGEVNAIQGKLDEGLARMKEVVAVEPTQLEALYGILSISELQGRRVDGEQMIADLYDRHPGSAHVAMVMSDVYAHRQDWSKRREVLVHAIKSEPENPGPYRLLAAEAFRDGRYKEAVHLGANSLARDQEEDSRRSTLDVVTQAALKAGDVAAAEKYLAMKRKENPFDLSLKEQERALVLLKQQ